MERSDKKAKRRTKSSRRTEAPPRKPGPQRPREDPAGRDDLGTHGETLERARAELALLEAHSRGPRETFGLYLYPSEDSVQGLIVHPLTDDLARFKGLDAAAIGAFLSKHLPQGQGRRTEAPPAASSTAEESSRSELASGVDALPRPHRLAVVPAGGGGLTMLHQGEPFEVKLEVDAASVQSEKAARLKYRVSVFAKRLEDGQRRAAGETSGDLDVAPTITATVPSEPLPLGTYRLETTATLAPMSEDPAQAAHTVSEQTLVRVH